MSKCSRVAYLQMQIGQLALAYWPRSRHSRKRYFKEIDMNSKTKNPAKRTKKLKVAKATKPDWSPNDAEKAWLEKHESERSKRVRPLRFEVENKGGGNIGLNTEHTNDSAIKAGAEYAFGTTEYEFASHQLQLLIGAATKGSEPSEVEINAAMAVMHRLQPRDEIEAMLISQMVAVNYASMIMTRRMNNAETLNQQNSASNAVNKLMRTYTTQMEALARYRKKGEQKMTVEHVHVHEGGQAMVGEFHQGGGKHSKTGEQAHAKAVTHAPGETLRSEDEARNAVPIARDAER